MLARDGAASFKGGTVFTAGAVYFVEAARCRAASTKIDRRYSKQTKLGRFVVAQELGGEFFRAAVLLAALAFLIAFPQPAHAQQPQNFDNVEIHILPVQGNVYMIIGAGGNVTMQAGDQGVLLVDTMYAGLSDKLLAAIRKISN